MVREPGAGSEVVAPGSAPPGGDGRRPHAPAERVGRAISRVPAAARLTPRPPTCVRRRQHENRVPNRDVRVLRRSCGAASHLQGAARTLESAWADAWSGSRCLHRSRDDGDDDRPSPPVSRTDMLMFLIPTHTESRPFNHQTRTRSGIIVDRWDGPVGRSRPSRMNDAAQMLPPVLEIYVVWHPGDREGARAAEQFLEHFHGTAFSGLIGGAVEIYVRSEGWGGPGDAPRPLPCWQPLPYGIPAPEITAIVPVLGDELAFALEAREGAWHDYAERIVAAQRSSPGTVGV